MTETFVRVNYSEIDQMGVVYHARYLVWLDVARCEHLRGRGMRSLELEARGLRLAVSELKVRYRMPARYDDLVRVRCWVRECVPRRVIFGYALDLPDTRTAIATAEVALLALKQDFSLSRLPPDVVALLPPEADPVRLF